jgi:hypothetical protein
VCVGALPAFAAIITMQRGVAVLACCGHEWWVGVGGINISAF